MKKTEERAGSENTVCGIRTTKKKKRKRDLRAKKRVRSRDLDHEQYVIQISTLAAGDEHAERWRER